MTKRYYNIDSEIVGDSVSGDYMRDALGSVTARTSTSSGDVLSTRRYKPYGATLSGSPNDSKFQWVGTAGYRQTSITHSESYVRARHYSESEARWITEDPMWMSRSSFDYALCSPIQVIDMSGLDPIALHLNAFIGRHLGAWIPEPPSMNRIGGLRYEFKGDDREFGEIGSDRIHTHFSIDSCAIGGAGSFDNNTGTSYRRVIGGDGTVYSSPAFNWLNIKNSWPAGKCITYFHGEVKSAYPFIRPMIAPTTVALQGYIWVQDKNSVRLRFVIKYSPFPDVELIGLIGPIRTILFTHKTPYPGLILMLPIINEERMEYYLYVPTQCCCTETPCCIGECPCSE